MPIVSSLAGYQPSQIHTTPQPLPPRQTQLLNYNCDGCMQGIPSTRPRVHCLTCVDHDLCANCALGERFVGGHTPAHPTQVFLIAGDSTVAPVASKVSISYGGAPPPTLGGTTSGGVNPAAPTTFGQPAKPSGSFIVQGGTVSNWGS
ncbi:hypothetical protein FB45DRAFT_1054312 [Roridomyces roridus]|uniref:ZZ-type domain-containing protein n=1 Tax=Roridomyces roridus TaxID=1738132 RepID=A0AAD7C929_9AGAR|nr:hypothetical protein FB45DRAFT_1054312 [Roridomyces roridus]